MSKASLCGDPDCPRPYEFCEACVRADERAKVREQIARDIEAAAAPYMKPPYPNIDQSHAYRRAIRIARGSDKRSLPNAARKRDAEPRGDHE